jgi:hypothetical protein
MTLHKRVIATAAVLGTLAIAAPVSGASAQATNPAPSPGVCDAVAKAGPMAVLGEYGPLGAYGPLGQRAGQPNPAASCGGTISMAFPGHTIGSFVTANLAIAQQAAGQGR